MKSSDKRAIATGILVLIGTVVAVIAITILFFNFVDDFSRALFDMVSAERDLKADQQRFEISSTLTIQLALAGIYSSALGAILVSSAVYVLVTREQKKQTDIQISIARMDLISRLEAEIDEVIGRLAVFESAGDPAKPFKHIPLLSVLDDSTEWDPSVERVWNYDFGERTIRFVKSSSVVSSNAEVSTLALHEYWNWIRRIRRGVSDGILGSDDLFHFWWGIYNCASHGRYSFFELIYFVAGVRDFLELIDMMLSDDRIIKDTAFAAWLSVSGDENLLSKLSEDSRTQIQAARAAHSPNIDSTPDEKSGSEDSA